MNRGSGDLKPAYGKWILAGEHTVIRGGAALVFPLYKKRTSLKFDHSEQTELKVSFSGEFGAELEILFWALLEKACEKLNLNRVNLKGKLSLDSNLPVGAGLGASAALCVSATRYFIELGHVKENELYTFARSLEDLFHGESSGVDVAASMSESCIEFCKDKEPKPVVINWKPNWFISYSGKRGITKECVQKVKQLEATHPNRFHLLDEQMNFAVQEAKSALVMDESEGFQKLARSISMARECFHGWGLDDGLLAEHLKQIDKLGAVAVKPTGSGGGGYVLSLWDKTPPEEFLKTALELN